MDAPEPEVVSAHVGDGQGRVTQVGALGEERAHLGGRLQPALCVAARDVRLCKRHQAPHALEHVGHERVARVEVAHRVRRDGADADPLGEPQHRSDLVAGLALEPVLDADEEPVATERLAERIEQSRAVIDAAGGRCTPRVRARSGDRDETGCMRADLERVDPRVAALAEHVRVGDEPAEVRVSDVVGREQHHDGHLPAAVYTPEP